MSSSVRWVISIVCAVLGVIALIYAVIYVSVPIHSLPGFVPGKNPVSGHYHKRALLVAIIGIVLLAIAALVGLGPRRSAAAPTGPSRSAADPASSAAEAEDAGDLSNP
jgi:uncharacterized membrane protein